MNLSIIGIILSIVIYLAFMLYIGYAFSKKTTTASDFYLGGRKLGPFVTAMSAEASDMSGWLLMGLPGVVIFINGFSYGSIAEAFWTAIGLGLGTYINWLIVAKRIRVYTAVANNSVTIPEFFENRFIDKTHLLRIVAAIIVIIFFVPYTASGFSTCGKLFSTIFHIDYKLAMILSAIIIVTYTTMGGFSAASQTDFIQSIVMTIALAIILIFGLTKAGGINEVIANAKAIPGYFSLTTQVSKEGIVQQYNIIKIISTLAWGLGYFGMPHILLRFMAIEDENKLKLSRRIASIWVIFAMCIAIFIGIIGYTLIKNGSISKITDGERIIIVIAEAISKNGFIFSIIAGLVLAGIVASTMSTADSQLLAAASSISEDIFKGVFKFKLSNKCSIIIARLTVVVISILGMVIALNENSSIFKIVSFAWAGFGAAFGPLVLFSVFWKRTNKYGAFAGMLTGGCMVFIWKYIVAPKVGGVFAIYELLPAFIISCIAIFVVSLLTPAPSKDIIDSYNKFTELLKK